MQLKRLFCLIALLFAACLRVNASESQSLEQRLLSITGDGVVRCGSFVMRRREAPGLEESEYLASIDCMEKASQAGKAFFLSLEGPGIDSYVASGILGLRSNTGLFRFSYDSSPCGGSGCGEAFGMSLCAVALGEGKFNPEHQCRIDIKRKTESTAPPPMRTARGICDLKELKLPDDFVVLAAGAYSGRDLGIQIDDSGHVATHINARINRTDKPVVLMLSAYEPTVWTIEWTEGTRIAAVMLSGYHRQNITGLRSDTPLLISTLENKHPCGHFYVSEEDAKDLRSHSRRLFKENIEAVYLAKEGAVTVGPAPSVSQKFLTSAQFKPESFADPNAPRVRRRGIEDAVKNGNLRQATLADFHAWKRIKAEQDSSSKTPTPVVVGGQAKNARVPNMTDTFVIVKPFVFPAGLYEYSPIFVLDKGVPKPTGNQGHSYLVNLNTGSCIPEILGCPGGWR